MAGPHMAGPLLEDKELVVAAGAVAAPTIWRERLASRLKKAFWPPPETACRLGAS